MPEKCLVWSERTLGLALFGLLSLGLPGPLRAQDARAGSPDRGVESIGGAQPATDCPTLPAAPSVPPASVPEEGRSGADRSPGADFLAAFPADVFSAEPGESAVPECPPPPVRPPPPNIFGLTAIPVGAKAANANWDRVRASSLEGAHGFWDELLDQANALTHSNPLAMVNRWVNWHVRFVDDRNADQWSSAVDTLARGSGDCEDFAIAKMALLQRLGVPADDMFLVLVRERLRPVDHAVLAVRRDGGFQVLDSRTDLVRPAEEITDYLPMLSYSGSFAWTYGRRIGDRMGTAAQ